MYLCLLRYYLPYLCWVLLLISTSTDLIYCCFAVRGNFKMCSWGFCINANAFHGNSCKPDSYSWTILLLTPFSIIYHLAAGKWCKMLFQCTHISHEMFQSFLINSATQHLPDCWLWALNQSCSWYSCQLPTNQPSRSFSSEGLLFSALVDQDL